MIVGVASPPHVSNLPCGKGRMHPSIEAYAAPSQRMWVRVTDLVLRYPAHLKCCGIHITIHLECPGKGRGGQQYLSFPKKRREVI